MELEPVLLACGFGEADAKLIIGEFFSGIGNMAESMGATDQKVGEILTEEQAAEILAKALDDRIAALPKSERDGINFEMLQRAFGYC